MGSVLSEPGVPSEDRCRMMADDADYMQALVLGKKGLLPRAGMSGLGIDCILPSGMFRSLTVFA